MADAIITLKGVRKQYSGHTAVNGLDLSIKKGEVFGLLGPNGAGKSTTILMLMGLSEPSGGQLRVCGIDPTRTPLLVKQKVGYLPEKVGFYENRSGMENLIYTALLNGIAEHEAKQKATALMQKVGLENAIDKKVGKYSRGMRQRLGLADALIKSPEVLILDEPTLGIDPKGVGELLALIKTLSKEDGLTVLLSSHHLHQVQQICDRVGLFVNGKLVASGNLEQLTQQLFPHKEEVIELTIGRDSEGKLSALSQSIKGWESVTQVHQDGPLLRIVSQENIAAVVAQEIANAGLGLSSLNRKEFGLNEIYQRYFEGDDNHAK